MLASRIGIILIFYYIKIQYAAGQTLEIKYNLLEKHRKLVEYSEHGFEIMKDKTYENYRIYLRRCCSDTQVINNFDDEESFDKRIDFFKKNIKTRFKNTPGRKRKGYSRWVG